MEYRNGKIKLTADERRAFFRRDWPRLGGEGKPPAIPRGMRVELSSRLSFEVQTLHRVRKGRAWEIEYKVIDDREERFYLMPSAANFEKRDETGKQIEVDIEDLPPEEEIGYTRNPKRRTVDEQPCVPPNIQKVIDARSRLAQAERLEKEEQTHRENAQVAGRRLKDVCTRMVRLGIDPTPMLADFQRQIEQAEQEMQEAA